jgi:hypothetical protein
VWIYRGMPSGVSGGSMQITMAGSPPFGFAIANVGDTDGDGFGELAVSRFAAGTVGTVYGFQGPSTSPRWMLMDGVMTFGNAIAWLGPRRKHVHPS